MSHPVSPPVPAPAFPHIAPAFLAEILFALFQTFMAGADGNIDAARHAALAALAAYAPQDEQELRLAAQIIQYSFGALDSLARSLDPDLPLSGVLRLRGSANALQRSANQCQRTLERLRKDRRLAQPQPQQAEAVAPPAETAPPASPEPAICPPAHQPSPTPATQPPAAQHLSADPASPAPAAPHPSPTDATQAPTAQQPCPQPLPVAPLPYADAPATVPWESMFRPLPPDATDPDADDDYAALRPAA